jgi:hypothetical protein
MELLNEINKMRNFMGLTPVNESYLLNEAVPPGLQSIIDDIIQGVKGGSKPTIDRVTKTAFNKFLKSNSIDDFLKDDKSSHYLIKWIKDTDGTNFRNALKGAIKKEEDMATRMSYNAYLKNFDELAQKEIPIYLDIPKPKTNTTKKPVTTTKTNTGSKTNTPNQSQIDKDNAAKLAKQRAENAKLLSKQLNDEVYQLEKIVVDFENKTVKEVLKNPALKQKVRDAKNFLDDIKTKDLSVLSKYKQTQLNSLEATIKNANPGVYSEITNFIGKGWAGFRKLHWGIQAIGVVLLVKFFGGKETGQILKNIWNGAISLGGDILRGMGILDDPETTPEDGTTPEDRTTPETTPDDDLEKFKKFIINDWKSDYREGYVSFRKDGNNYIATDSSVNQEFYYIKNNNTFQYVPE